MIVFKLFYGDVIPWIDNWYCWLYGPIPNPSLSYGVSFTLTLTLTLGLLMVFVVSFRFLSNLLLVIVGSF